MKSVIAHGLLAVLGLFAAYRTWTHEEKEEQLPGEATVMECDPKKLVSVEMETPTHITTYIPKRVGATTQFWITTTRKPPEPKPDADKEKDKDKTAKAADAGAAKPAAPEKTAKKGEKPEEAKPAEPPKPEPPKNPRPYDPDAPINFLASKKFDTTLRGLAPLRAVRALGELKKSKDKDFGFDKVGTFLRIDCGDKKIAIDLGARTYGSGEQYGRDPKTHQAYLMSGQQIMDLESAQYKFMQADLHDFALTDVDEVVVKAQGKEKKLLHRNRLIPTDARWVDAAAPDKRNELYGNWFQRLDRLKIKAYLAEGKEPGSDLAVDVTSMQPIMTVDYKLEGKPKGKLELARADTKQGNFYYARTELSPRWTVMYDSIAKQVEEDVAMVVGAEEAPTQSVPVESTGPSAAPAASPTTTAASPHGAPAAATATPPASPHPPAAPSPSASPRAPAPAPASRPSRAAPPANKAKSH